MRTENGTLTKYSRRDGNMTLHSYASGSGAISFTWQNHRREASGHPITESDISEYLEIPAVAERFKGWQIFDSSDSIWPVLVHPVKRRGKVKLETDGETYRYEHPVSPTYVFSDYNTTFSFNPNGRALHKDWTKLKNLNLKVRMLYFLNHEDAMVKSVQGCS